MHGMSSMPIHIFAVNHRIKRSIVAVESVKIEIVYISAPRNGEIACRALVLNVCGSGTNNDSVVRYSRIQDAADPRLPEICMQRFSPDHTGD